MTKKQRQADCYHSSLSQSNVYRCPECGLSLAGWLESRKIRPFRWSGADSRELDRILADKRVPEQIHKIAARRRALAAALEAAVHEGQRVYEVNFSRERRPSEFKRANKRLLRHLSAAQEILRKSHGRWILLGLYPPPAARNWDISKPIEFSRLLETAIEITSATDRDEQNLLSLSPNRTRESEQARHRVEEGVVRALKGFQIPPTGEAACRLLTLTLRRGLRERPPKDAKRELTRALERLRRWQRRLKVG